MDEMDLVELRDLKGCFVQNLRAKDDIFLHLRSCAFLRSFLKRYSV